MGKKFCSVGCKWCKLLQHGICKVANTDVNNINKCPRVAEIETTTLYTIIREVEFEKVFERLCFYWESQSESESCYRKVFNELLKKKQYNDKKHNLNDLFINIEIVNEDNSDYLNVYGVNPNKPNGTRYGIEFCPWAEWVNMFITKETLNSLSKEDIVAGCLFEMTFDGFDEKQIQEHKQKLIDTIKKYKENK